MKTLAITLLALSLFSCKPEVTKAAADAPAKEAAADKTAKKTEGEHKPPIEKSEVKDGHWYCDMGTVHYSRPDEGDAKCPLCGMKLHHKKPAAK